jgi:hypothetical protein
VELVQKRRRLYGDTADNPYRSSNWRRGHAPQNCFFFVIDRSTGYDANGRPIEVPEARQNNRP